MSERPPVTDAEFEVISGPLPVRSEPRPPQARQGDPWYKWVYAGLIGLLALYVLLLGLGGADLDTTDAVKADEARQPVAVDIR